MLTTCGTVTETRALPMARPWWIHERGLSEHQQMAKPPRDTATSSGASTSTTGHDDQDPHRLSPPTRTPSHTKVQAYRSRSVSRSSDRVGVPDACPPGSAYGPP